MLEWGQPMHAFDMSKIGGSRIIVRRAKPGEKLKTLDGETRVLDSTDLLICDISKPIAIGGVMGGEESEIGPGTKDVVLESAYFDPRTVRKTSKKLALQSESSYRFERGVCPHGVRKALLRAALLLEKYAGGKAEKSVIDLYPNEIKQNKIVLKSSRVEKLLGIKISPAKIKGILTGLEMDVKNYGDVDFEVTVPFFRGDITKDVDLIEEVARIYGYSQIPATLPETLPEPEFQRADREALKTIENILVGAGFRELKNYSFIHEEDNGLFTGSDPEREGETLKILNPISEEMSVMRQSLLPSLIKNLSYHRARNIEDLKIYEIDKTFHIFNHNCTERRCLTLAMMGKDYSDRWDYRGRKIDFYDVKGIFEEISTRFKLKRLAFKSGSSRKYLHPKLSADIFAGEKHLGALGMIHMDIANRFELDEAYILEIYLDEFLSILGKEVLYSTFSRFPAVERDISLVVDISVSHDEILKSMKGIKSELVKEIRLFDHYRGDQVPKGKKSLSYRIIYQSFERTLTDSEVQDIHEKMLDSLTQDVKAELRK